MVDNNQDNDEYQFSDLDVMGSDMMDDEDTAPMQSEVVERHSPQKNIRRNALIVVVLVILAMVVYKFMGAFFSSKTDQVATKKTTPSAIQPIPQETQSRPVQPVVTQQTTPSVTSSSSNQEVNQKLAALEISQQNMRSEVTTVNNQLSGLSSNLNSLADKIAALSQTVNTLADKVEQQSRELAVISARTRPKLVRPKVRATRSLPVYYIQAVIPGRAWLIATNGSTLTVREGTKVAGYGVVKLIDAIQGRVVMSSGKVIRFSQQDS
ncbi:type IVB secretion system protein IcmG/DotF [Legionella spiritensis]|uniref:type IVB secretion system protein IcmG/DotF n=1 Tax=Legionella spiritensis TaxID=452 RepID=UPI000F6EEAE4|nr:type IVB secretion system protein IcmG/DotF [Legionella spiritensis]VEG90786.1 protein IcmG (DotF) [Legionella spiritensis]